MQLRGPKNLSPSRWHPIVSRATVSSVKKCCQILQQWSGAAKVFLTPSCTSALEMSALLLDLKPGDEVIVPSFTFVSSVCAFVIFWAKPVFVDVLPDTFCMDPDSLEKAITPRTKIIVPVHYAGVACPMERIVEIAQGAGAHVVEDNAQGVFASYQGKPLGSFGTASTISFHETKNIGCGEGGALVLNDPALLERAEIMQEKGTNRSRFLMGQVDKYTWVDRGSSYLLGELPAALLYANLLERELIQSRRLAIWNEYRDRLADWAESHQIRLPHIPAGVDHPAHLFYLLLPNLEKRQSLTEHMRARGVQTTYHYQPLHLSPMGVQAGGYAGQCPVTEQVADRLLRLPLFVGLRPEDQQRIIEALFEWK